MFCSTQSQLVAYCSIRHSSVVMPAYNQLGLVLSYFPFNPGMKASQTAWIHMHAKIHQMCAWRGSMRGTCECPSVVVCRCTQACSVSCVSKLFLVIGLWALFCSPHFLFLR